MAGLPGLAPVRQAMKIAVPALAIVAAVGAAGCGDDAPPGLEDVLRGTLQQAGFENPLEGAPRTYEGAFSLAPDRFKCALRTTGAYCVDDDGLRSSP